MIDVQTNSLFFRFIEQGGSDPLSRGLRHRHESGSDVDRGQDVDHHQVDDHNASRNPGPVAVHLQQHDVCHGKSGQRRSSFALHGEAGGS